MNPGDITLLCLVLTLILFYCLAPIIHYCIRSKCLRNTNIHTSKPNEISTIERDGHKTQEQIDKSFEGDLNICRYISVYFHVGVIGLVLYIIIVNVTRGRDPGIVIGLTVLCGLFFVVSVLCILFEIMTSYECKYVCRLKQEKPLREYLKGNN